jgi:hypothetical protein
MVPGWPVAKVSQIATVLKLPKLEAERQSGLAQGLYPEYAALLKLLEPGQNLVSTLGAGHVVGADAASLAANALLARARQLAARETFFHWHTSFPNVFGPGTAQGFDAVIGNPPWDRIKLQEVEWFSERSPAIAAQSRAADRKAMIAALQNVNMTQTGTNTPPPVDLWAQYQTACERAETNARVLGNGKLGSGDYPLLGGGDVNLYSLFIERAQSLIHPQGVVALITPSGIAADKGAAEFFRSISSTGKLHALFDFENRKVFFPDVDSRFKFCALVFGKAPRMTTPQSEGEPPQALPSRCAFYLHSLAELDEPGRVLTLSAQDFQRVNPNTSAAPIFRNQRDADITLKLYKNHPVLVKHGKVSEALGQQADVRVWPVKYATMFHMTNDSHLFLKSEELVKQGWKAVALNRWEKTDTQDAKGTQLAVPLYEGKMVQMFDHRAADVVVNEDNLHRAAQQEAISQIEKASPTRYPVPQFFVAASQITSNPYEWAIGYKEISAPTNARSMIATLLPGVAFGNKVPLLIPQAQTAQAAVRTVGLIAANFNAFAFDFVLRQKLQGQTINLFILEQLPVITPSRFDEPLPEKFTQAMRAAKLMNGHHPQPTVADFVLPQVLALTYTAHDMAPFARDMGYVDSAGQVLPPFVWDEEERRMRLAALDAVFFWLYGLDANDAAYMLDTFPIVCEHDQKTFGCYRTKDDILKLLSLLPKPELLIARADTAQVAIKK